MGCGISTTECGALERVVSRVWGGCCSHPSDVGGEQVDAVSVEVAAGAVVVLGGARVGVPCEDLGVAERDPGLEGVGDGRVPQ